MSNENPIPAAEQAPGADNQALGGLPQQPARQVPLDGNGITPENLPQGDQMELGPDQVQLTVRGVAIGMSRVVKGTTLRQALAAAGVGNVDGYDYSGASYQNKSIGLDDPLVANVELDSVEK